MVYAFIIHTLLPGPCKVLFYNIYGNDIADLDLKAYDSASNAELRTERKQQIQIVADQCLDIANWTKSANPVKSAVEHFNEVHSEFQFRRDVANRTVEDDKQVLNNEDTLPDLELGFLRLREGDPFPVERTVIWLGAGNTGFTLVCHKEENRLTAENVLRLLIRYLQDHIRVINQPAEAALKADKVCVVLNTLLPDGALLFMNHRVVRGLEKELEVLMKT